MRFRSAGVCAAAILAGEACVPAPPVAPPVEMRPTVVVVPPAAAGDGPAAGAASAAASAAGSACGAWSVRWTRHEQTHVVATCQVAAIELASDVTAQVRRTAPDRITVHVARDVESTTNLPAAADLSGETYVVALLQTGPEVRHESGAPVTQDEVARRVRALAETVLPWEAPLEKNVEAVAAVEAHGPMARVTTTVHPEGGGPGAFAVTLLESEGDAGMCHRWETTRRLYGELALREGVLGRLALRGPIGTTQALCPEGARESGASAAPRTCTAGEVSLAVEVTCAPPGAP